MPRSKALAYAHVISNSPKCAGYHSLSPFAQSACGSGTESLDPASNEPSVCIIVDGGEIDAAGCQQSSKGAQQAGNTFPVDNLYQLLDHVRLEQERSMAWTYVLTGIALIMCIMLAAITGFVVRYASVLQAITLANGRLLSTQDGLPARVGSSDMSVQDGRLVALPGPSEVKESGQSGEQQQPTVVQTAQFLHSWQLSPQDNLQDLAALHEVCISDTCSGAQLCLTVMGAMHVRSSSSKAGKVARLLTLAGSVTLDGTALSFSSDLTHLFLEAGFTLNASQHVLLSGPSCSTAPVAIGTGPTHSQHGSTAAHATAQQAVPSKHTQN